MSDSKGLMAGKRGLVMGVANDRSIAWGIAKAVAAQGGELAFTYQGEALERRVKPLAQSINADIVVPCDVTDEASIDATFATLNERWGSLDFVIHAVAFSDKEELKGKYVDTTRGNFLRTLDISCFSFTAVAARAQQLMTNGGSLVTLTYLGAERVMPHYNVMGVAKASLEASTRYLAYDLGPKKIRVNCISAGPVNTLAARGIAGFGDMLKHYDAHAPLGRSCDPKELGATGVFLASEGAASITGQVLYVDGGYEIMGM